MLSVMMRYARQMPAVCVAIGTTLAISIAVAGEAPAPQNAQSPVEALQSAEPLPPQHVRYPDCPPTNARGRPQMEFQLSGFRSKEHAEQATFDYLKCFASIGATQEWLAEQGFGSFLLSSLDHPVRIPGTDGSERIGKTLSASRSLEKYPPIWGGILSRSWQKLVSQGTAVGISFYTDDTVQKIQLHNLIL